MWIFMVILMYVLPLDKVHFVSWPLLRWRGGLLLLYLGVVSFLCCGYWIANEAGLSRFSPISLQLLRSVSVVQRVRGAEKSSLRSRLRCRLGDRGWGCPAPPLPFPAAPRRRGRCFTVGSGWALWPRLCPRAVSVCPCWARRAPGQSRPGPCRPQRGAPGAGGSGLPRVSSRCPRGGGGRGTVSGAHDRDRVSRRWQEGTLWQLGPAGLDWSARQGKNPTPWLRALNALLTRESFPARFLNFCPALFELAFLGIVTRGRTRGTRRNWRAEGTGAEPGWPGRLLLLHGGEGGGGGGKAVRGFPDRSWSSFQGQCDEQTVFQNYMP